ncbi:MAG: ABC transporter substrate-binding protein [Methanobacteriota archaeon]
MSPNNPALLSLVALSLLVAGCTQPAPSPDGDDGETREGFNAAGAKVLCPGEEAEEAETMVSGPQPAPSAIPFISDISAIYGVSAQPGDPTLMVKIGTLLPLTGNLAAYGTSGRNAIDLAADQINNLTSVTGLRVEIVHRDGPDATQAPNAMDSLLNERVSAVIGAYSSGVTGSILDKAKENEVPVVTPASTAPDLTMRENDGLFFRIPPSDTLQGQILARLVYDAGCRTAGLLAVNNAYGTGLGDVFRDHFTRMGGNVTRYVKFLENQAVYSSDVSQAARDAPDAVVFVGYPGEGKVALKNAYESGAMEDSVFFFSEGVFDSSFVGAEKGVGKDADGNFILAGLRGTTPVNNIEGQNFTGATANFTESYRARHREAPRLFATEAYDATVEIALAALHAGSSEGAGIRDSLRTVVNSPGPKTSDLRVALTLAKARQDLDWIGAAGDFDWDEKGDPEGGVYAYWRVTEAGGVEPYQSGFRLP